MPLFSVGVYKESNLSGVFSHKDTILSDQGPALWTNLTLITEPNTKYIHTGS